MKIVSVEGQVRAVRELRRKSESGAPVGAVFARVASVLTEAGGVLGETLDVTLYIEDAPHGHTIQPGDDVHWACAVDSSKYGLRATYKAEIVDGAGVSAADDAELIAF